MSRRLNFLALFALTVIATAPISAAAATSCCVCIRDAGTNACRESRAHDGGTAAVAAARSACDRVTREMTGAATCTFTADVARGCATISDCAAGVGVVSSLNEDASAVTPTPAPAQTTPAPTFTPAVPTLALPIPTLPSFSALQVQGDGGNRYVDVPFVAEYIVALYRFSLGIIVTLAMVMIVIGGLRWVTAAGNASSISAAKETITRAVMGLLIAFGSYTILFLINPELVNFRSIRVDLIKTVDVERPNGGNSEEARTGTTALRGASGDRDQYRLTSCDGLATSGAEFEAAFTNYYAPSYGSSAGGYSAPWELANRSDPASRTVQKTGNEPTTNVPWSFYCSVAMECSCPRGQDTSLRCYGGGRWDVNGERHGWSPCNPFGRSTPYCGGPAADGTPSAGRKRLAVGQTLAADKNCFSVSSGCQVQVDGGRILEITDSGSGIRGRRFDTFTNEAGEGAITGVHTVKILNPTVCRQASPYRGGIP